MIRKYCLPVGKFCVLTLLVVLLSSFLTFISIHDHVKMRESQALVRGSEIEVAKQVDSTTEYTAAFKELCLKHGTDKATTHQYHLVYPKFFQQLRKKPINFLEFGYYKGSSVKLWKEYFSPEAKLHFVDIQEIKNPVEDVSLHIGDQTDKNFLRKVCREHGPFDIVVDDGAHTMKSMRTTMQEMWQCIKPCGFLAIEDLESSYFQDSKKYGGGYLHPNSIIEDFKKIIDVIHSRLFDPSYSLFEDDDRIEGLHCYFEVCILEKKCT